MNQHGRPELRAVALLALESRKQARQKREVARRSRSRLDRRTHPGSQGRTQARLERECEEQRDHTDVGPDQRSQGQQRQGGGRGGRCARQWGHGSSLDLAPAHEGRYVELGADVVSEQTQVLSQVQSIAKLPDGRLSIAYLGDVRGREQPACELVLSGGSASAAQQLEQRALSEQVEIRRKGMRGVQVGLSLTATARPPLFEPLEPPFVECGCAFCPTARSDHPIVSDEQDAEQRDRWQHPCVPDLVGPEREEPQRDCDREGREPNSGQPSVRPCVAVGVRRARLEPAAVLQMRLGFAGLGCVVQGYTGKRAPPPIWTACAIACATNARPSSTARERA